MGKRIKIIMKPWPEFRCRISTRIFIRSHVRPSRSLHIHHRTLSAASHMYRVIEWGTIHQVEGYVEMPASLAMRSRFFFSHSCCLWTLDEHFYEISKLGNWIFASFSFCFLYSIPFSVLDHVHFNGNMHIQHEFDIFYVRRSFFHFPFSISPFPLKSIFSDFSSVSEVRAWYIGTFTHMSREHTECVIRPMVAPNICRFLFATGLTTFRIVFCANTFSWHRLVDTGTESRIRRNLHILVCGMWVHISLLNFPVQWATECNVVSIHVAKRP